MTITTNALEYILSLKGLFSVIGVLIVIVLFVYILFAFLLTRQVKLLNKNFSTPLSGALTQMAFAHLLIAIGVTAMALVNIL